MIDSFYAIYVFCGLFFVIAGIEGIVYVSAILLKLVKHANGFPYFTTKPYKETKYK